MILPVIMAGGSGTRLWPLSRKLQPKQFLALAGDSTMLQDTIARLEGLSCSDPLLICGEDHRFTAAEQLRQLGLNQGKVILEPAGRNTAPAIALAALHAKAEGLDPLLLVLAADHVITQPADFRAAVDRATPLAEAGKLVTFGIVATGPETGYGYIKRSDELPDTSREQGQSAGYRVGQFVEKPDLATAEQYVASGNYYWNSGMFLIRASRYLEELKIHSPEILAACEKSMVAAVVDTDFVRAEKEAFLACPDDSIDYAVMEPLCSKADGSNSAVVVPMDCGWSDVGSWPALWEVSEKDAGGNACHGEVMLEGASNCYVRACGDKLVAAIGVEDLIVVDTDDALLVSTKENVQKVKDIVGRLKADKRESMQAKASNHRKVFRPWGYYDSIDFGERFQVKRIVVNPGAQLSLQMHHHRAEHWVVVSGTALVTKGNEEILLGENQSTYIPLGVTHRLYNPGVLPLEMIEVQSGSYLGEDDIVRFEDKYGRG
jgi:mannose-1-phosphate guanylyltransferase/mannose-6-phosphate isomerase